MMKHFQQILILAIFLIGLNACTLSRFVFYNTANIDDYTIFPSRSIKNNGAQFHFEKNPKGKAPKSLSIKGKTYPFDDFLKKNHTVAFLIIQNDSIQYENYFDQYSDSSIVASFSASKSILSILIGCAIDDQLILSEEEAVSKYIPELKENGFDQVRIKDLLQMTSGLQFNESYLNPFGHAAPFYYGRNLRKACFKLKLEAPAGRKFEYKSGNSQLLGIVLERALKGQSISSYLEEKIWQALGMEYDASWSIDQKKNGIEKTFCCINARARDFAKIGRLYLNKGKWNGKTIVSEKWVETSTKIDSSQGSSPMYQYHWWLPNKQGDFCAHGVLGQYIYVSPRKNLIIVRLGKKEGKHKWFEILNILCEAYD